MKHSAESTEPGGHPDEGVKVESINEQESSRRLDYVYPVSGVASLTNPDKQVMNRRSFLGRLARGGAGAWAFYEMLQQKSHVSEADLFRAYFEHKDENYKILERQVLEHVEAAAAFIAAMTDEEGIQAKIVPGAKVEEQRMQAFGNFLDMKGEVAAAREGIAEMQPHVTPDDDYKRMLFKVHRDLEKFLLYTKSDKSYEEWMTNYAVVTGIYYGYESILAAQELRARYDVSVEVAPGVGTSGLRYVQQFYDLFPAEVVRNHFPKRIVFSRLPIGGGTAFPPGDAIIITGGSYETTAHEIAHYLSVKNGINEFGPSNLGITPRSQTHQAFRELNTEDVPYTNETGAGYIVEDYFFGAAGKKPMPDKGYINEYAYGGGEEEDMAEVSTALFNRFSLTHLLVECQTDPVLRAKAEFVAGFKQDGPPVWSIKRWNSQHIAPEVWEYFSKYGTPSLEQFKLSGLDYSSIQHYAHHPYRGLYEYANEIEFTQVPTFGTKISEAEYRAKKFDGVAFWRKWTDDFVTAEFYNSILRGEKHGPEDKLAAFRRPRS